MTSGHYFFPILTDVGRYRQILVKIPNVKFQENRPVGMALVRVDIRPLVSY